MPTPYLIVDRAEQAIEHYKRAFGAKERTRVETRTGKIAHAELEIGDSLVMLRDPLPRHTTRPPEDLGGTSAGILVYVDDVEAVVKQAILAGAKLTTEVADRPWGDRVGEVTDLFGHVWLIATRVEGIAEPRRYGGVDANRDLERQLGYTAGAAASPVVG
jgi:PhnB protein